ncbi:snoRNA-binding protein [Coemansia javaensis]|uniref:H/ACA ribonucleoprotein complex subunit 2 n=1 Tax=Coemansia javaensis TaxID=2761396 RepID=A0A9W8LNE4_9FUNG|nr:snoRNA-binding protein [Coemansia javaensis]
MGKSSKKERRESGAMMVEDTAGDGAAVVDAAQLAPIAHPLADRKLAKKTLKAVKKAAKHRHVKRGVKEVVKGLRKGDRGLVVLAGNISPMDVLSHIPVLCEDHQVPYIFVPSKEELGGSCSTKRPTCCLMIVPGGKGAAGESHADYKEAYDECFSTALDLNKKLVATAAAGVVVA